jgi:hypothetical protein
VTTREPYVLTPADLLDAETRLFRADVELAARSPVMPSAPPHWPAKAAIPLPGTTSRRARGEHLRGEHLADGQR